jgi:hypothetical protein
MAEKIDEIVKQKFLRNGYTQPGQSLNVATAKSMAAEIAQLVVADERGRVIDYLQHRCSYAPPCGSCTYCLTAKSLFD